MVIDKSYRSATISLRGFTSSISKFDGGVRFIEINLHINILVRREINKPT